MDELLEGLKDADPDNRAECARKLGIDGIHEAVPHLVRALKDKEPLVRANAALALGHLKPSGKSVEALIPMLADEEWMVRHDASMALGELGDIHAVAPLVDLLSDPVLEVRMKAVDALGKLGDEKGLQALEKHVDDLEVLDELVLAFSRNKCNHSLIKLYDMGSDDIRIKAIGGIEPDMAHEEVFLRAIKDDSWRVREEAAKALGVMNTEASVKGLRKLLRDSSHYVVIQALRALVKVDDRDSLEKLESLGEHPEPAVRGEWARTTASLGGDFRDILDAFLYENDSRTKWVMAESMGEDTGFRDELKDAYRDAVGDEKVLLACSLAWSGDKTGIDDILDAMVDMRWKVRQKATESVTNIQWDILNKKERKALMRTMEGLLEDTDKWVRIAAIKALWTISRGNEEEGQVRDLLENVKESEMDPDVREALGYQNFK